MTFLNSRREKLENRLDGSSNKSLDKSKRRKLTKAADTEAEISKYFTSAKSANIHEKRSQLQSDPQVRRRSRVDESPQAVVELPDRPFLGFGSCGPNTSMSPAKSLDNRDSRSLHRGISRSPTRSTSYLPWSQSREPSDASPAPKRRQDIEPLQSSKLSNRKRTSPDSRKDRHSVPLVASIGVQTTSPRVHVPSRPSSKHENANEGPSQNHGSKLAEEEQLKPRDDSQNSIDARKTGPDAGKNSRNIEASIPDNTHLAKAAILDDLEIASSSREPPAHDRRPPSAQMPNSPAHTDQLDDILEELRKGCNLSLAECDPTSHPTLSNCDLNVLEKPMIPASTRECLDKPVQAVVSNVYAPEASRLASDSSRKLRSASLQLASSKDGRRSTHTQSKGSLTFDDEVGLGNTADHRSIPTQYQTDSRSAWTGYNNFYERQQDQSNQPKIFAEDLARCSAVGGSSLELSRGTDLGTGPSENVSGHNLSDNFGSHGSYLFRASQVGDGDDSYQEASHDGWYDENVDHGASYGSRISTLGVSQEDFEDEIVATDHANEHQEREGLLLQEADAQETEHRLLTINVPHTCSWRRPRNGPGSSFGLKAYAADDGVQDVDPALSKFWTPHKLY